MEPAEVRVDRVEWEKKSSRAKQMLTIYHLLWLCWRARIFVCVDERIHRLFYDFHVYITVRGKKIVTKRSLVKWTFLFFSNNIIWVLLEPSFFVRI